MIFYDEKRIMLLDNDSVTTFRDIEQFGAVIHKLEARGRVWENLLNVLFSSRVQSEDRRKGVVRSVAL